MQKFSIKGKWLPSHLPSPSLSTSGTPPPLHSAQHHPASPSKALAVSASHSDGPLPRLRGDEEGLALGASPAFGSWTKSLMSLGVKAFSIIKLFLP